MLFGLFIVLAALSDVIRVTSPNGQAVMEFTTHAAAAVYRVTFRGREVIAFSRLGLDFDGTASLGDQCDVVSVETRPRTSEYVQFPGKRRLVHERGTETIVHLREQGSPRRYWELQLRAYDEGVAFRYAMPAGDRLFVVSRERTTFALPADAVGYALPLNSFTTSYESATSASRSPPCRRSGCWDYRTLRRFPARVGWRSPRQT